MDRWTLNQVVELNTIPSLGGVLCITCVWVLG